VKRTALGRVKHENAAVTVAPDGRVVVYMGDDEKFEYIYKFVSEGTVNPNDRAANKNLLDKGTLYVARFKEDGGGIWLPLTPDNPDLKEFANLGEILIHARFAADKVGATKMDRPEWIAIDPLTRQVCVSLTGNPARLEPDGPNPRAKNEHGHILRWHEPDPTAEILTWDVFVMAGDPESTVETNQGAIKGDLFSSPDGLAFDSRGVLWVETDISSGKMNHPAFTPDRVEFAAFGNNQMLAVDPATGIVRRFLTGPIGCEITGFTMTPDARTLFINIQHPGEPLDDLIFASEASQPTRFSTWPYGGRPRSATVVITKNDGGVIGT
jgi:secreted PhoX family phosphatase